MDRDRDLGEVVTRVSAGLPSMTARLSFDPIRGPAVVAQALRRAGFAETGACWSLLSSSHGAGGLGLWTGEGSNSDRVPATRFADRRNGRRGVTHEFYERKPNDGHRSPVARRGFRRPDPAKHRAQQGLGATCVCRSRWLGLLPRRQKVPGSIHMTENKKSARCRASRRSG
jgi:hypothetical protein